MLNTQIETLENGRKLRVARLGKGPPILLLHGYPDNLQIWERLAPLLASNFEVIAFDWPGMGNSEAWPGGASPQHMSNRILTLIEHWNIPKASLIGIDMGGQPALVFAAQNPSRIDKLVVMNSLLFGEEKTSLEIKVLRKFGWNRWILRNLPQQVFRRAERTFLPKGDTLSEALRKDLWESFRRREVRVFISKMCAGYQGTLPELPDYYAKVKCPTMALWAEKDKHFPPIHANKLKKVNPNTKLQLITKAEHWMVWHVAERVCQALIPFLNTSAHLEK